MDPPRQVISRPNRLDPSGSATFDLPLVPRRWNAALSRYFSANPRRLRVYRLLLSLLRLHELRAANAIAFDLFLALVPMLALVGWAVSKALAEDSDALLSGSLLLGVTPYEFRSFVLSNLLILSGTNLAPFAMLAGWWLSSSAFFTLVAVFEDSFDCSPRPYWQTTLLSLGFALLGFVMLVLAATSSVLLGIGHVIRVHYWIETLHRSFVLRCALIAAAYLGSSTYFAFLYRYAIRRSGARRIWPGALFAAGIGSAASFAFGLYASHIKSYALFYGGLAAVAIALLWLWLWCTAVLIGAEINFTLEDLRLLDGELVFAGPERFTQPDRRAAEGDPETPALDPNAAASSAAFPKNEG